MTADFDAKLFGKRGIVGVFGPGMGKTPAHWEIIKRALQSEWPLVLDGDALTLLEEHADDALPLLAQRRALTCLTPHPQEASRLLSTTTEEIQADRFASSRKISERWHSVVVLKGKGTVLTAPRRPFIVVTSGDTGLAKGGSGDILAGVIASLIGQTQSETGPAVENVALAVYLHGRASELVTQAKGTERSHLAHEIVDQISEAYRELETCAS
jgi:NAD(P)H-hydrate epimerase